MSSSPFLKKLQMVTMVFCLVLSALVSLSILCSASHPSLNKHYSSLSVENAEDFLISSNGIFSAGFYQIGGNAYCFAIWFNRPHCKNNCTIVWMANRDAPVNGRSSKLTLQRNGDLVLTDANQFIVWSTNTVSTSSVQLLLEDTGNLVLHNIGEGGKLWQSFDSPTDTLLPEQPLTRDMQLISSRSQTNHSSGYYKLLFHEDNILFLVFDGPETSSVYWPDPLSLDDQGGRSRYNDSRTAVFDTKGSFLSSDQVKFRALDFGAASLRRLTLDFDGNLRLYSFEEAKGTWSVTWQAVSRPCRIHGACGQNSICIYDPHVGRKCTCPPGFKMKNHTDWNHGCEPQFKLSCNKSEVSFLELHGVNFFGYFYQRLTNYTLENCKRTCLDMCNCKGFLYIYMESEGYYNCFPKRDLRNGHRSSNNSFSLYLKLPKSRIPAYNESYQESQLHCSQNSMMQLHRTYDKNGGIEPLKILLLCAYAVALIEVISMSAVFLFLNGTHSTSDRSRQGHLVPAAGLRRFTYSELKKATGSFKNELGRGGAGIVYKGVLSDKRIAAIKCLKDASQGEDEFLAEISTIGRLNHMNLIDMWGYCIEGKNRLLVYEFMEHGSVADKLWSNSLDWEKRFAIAVGTAKGLAYLHEECLEWVLHCDVKPQNILLDSNYMPKVADFGLSKMLNRVGVMNSSFSTVRGTRGYMAPEWVLNSPITSKVDVYSYGMVVLEMATGRSPAMVVEAVDSKGEVGHRRLVAWVRETKQGAAAMASWVEEIIDPLMGKEYDVKKLETLVEVALQCVNEDKDARPTMRQVVEMLLACEVDDTIK